MFKILEKKQLTAEITLLEIEAERISKKTKPGQFVIVRIDEYGERIPLTIAETSIYKKSITIIVQSIGATTKKLASLEKDDSILDLVGPLGKPTEFDNAKNICVIGGGVGCAIAYPSAKYCFDNGLNVDIIAGFRNKDYVILEDKMKNVAHKLVVTTDDGSFGVQGFVTDQLEKLLMDNEYDLVIAIGPVKMMQAVCNITKPKNIKTLVSLNPIMIDGTGMCGGCRVTIAGQTKFACVDGPDFDGHLVDFNELINRNNTYLEQESHACKMEESI